MFKKLSKLFVATIMCTLLVAGTVSAAPYATAFDTGSLTLDTKGNPVFTYTTSYNYKYDVSQPWTLNITSIQCQGSYGIRFCPVKVDGSTFTSCTQSGIWRNTTGWAAVTFAAGDARVGQYTLGARRDDDYAYTGNFSASGWWSSDRVTFQ